MTIVRKETPLYNLAVEFYLQTDDKEKPSNETAYCGQQDPTGIHHITIEEFVPDAWGIGAGLRLGVEGDAGEWEFAGLLMKAPRE